MSYYEDQFDAWMANDCKGRIEDYDGTEFPVDETKPAGDLSFPFGCNEEPARRGQLTSWESIARFMYAGNATFTIVSLKTGTRFTYKVKKAKNPSVNAEIFFVGLLRGPSNEDDYAYMGCIRNREKFYTSDKSRITDSAPSMIAFKWLVNEMGKSGNMNPQLQVWHEGRCCRCGRKLTVPESVESGLGPECAGRMAA